VTIFSVYVASTERIYRILRDGLEQFYSNPEVRRRHEDDEWKTDQYYIGGSLRSPLSEDPSSPSSTPLEGGEPIDPDELLLKHGRGGW